VRADIHTLFDRDLMAINPQTMTLWISDRIKDSVYARLDGKDVKTSAGLGFLRFQYRKATGAGQE
jgi:hypothetical protein